MQTRWTVPVSIVMAGLDPVLPGLRDDVQATYISTTRAGQRWRQLSGREILIEPINRVREVPRYFSEPAGPCEIAVLVREPNLKVQMTCTNFQIVEGRATKSGAPADRGPSESFSNCRVPQRHEPNLRAGTTPTRWVC
jgi:hydroxypyruvate isomerase